MHACDVCVCVCCVDLNNVAVCERTLSDIFMSITISTRKDIHARTRTYVRMHTQIFVVNQQQFYWKKKNKSEKLLFSYVPITEQWCMQAVLQMENRFNKSINIKKWQFRCLVCFVFVWKVPILEKWARIDGVFIRQWRKTKRVQSNAATTPSKWVENKSQSERRLIEWECFYSIAQFTVYNFCFILITNTMPNERWTTTKKTHICGALSSHWASAFIFNKIQNSNKINTKRILFFIFWRPNLYCCVWSSLLSVVLAKNSNHRPFMKASKGGELFFLPSSGFCGLISTIEVRLKDWYTISYVQNPNKQ